MRSARRLPKRRPGKPSLAMRMNRTAAGMRPAPARRRKRRRGTDRGYGFEC